MEKKINLEEIANSSSVRLAQIEYNKRKDQEEMEQYLALKNKFEK